MRMTVHDAEYEGTIEDEFEPLMRLYDAKKVLNVGWDRMAELVRSGELKTFNVSGELIERGAVTPDFRGLRVMPSELRRYIESIRL